MGQGAGSRGWLGPLLGAVVLFATPAPAWALVSLAVEMSATPDPVGAGGDLSYTIRVTNSGDEAAQDLQIESSIPLATSFVQAPGALLGSGNAVIWSIGTLAGGGGQVTVTLVVEVDFPTVAENFIVNAAIATATGAALASAGTLTAVRPLGVSMSVRTDPEDCEGSAFREYTIGFSNGASTSVTNLELSAEIPTGTVVTTAPFGGETLCLASDPNLPGSGSPCTSSADCGGGERCKAFWSIGTMAAGSASARSFRVRIPASVPAGTSFASSGVLRNGGDFGADSAPLTKVEDVPCPKLAKVDLGSGSVEPGGTIDYLLVSANRGRAALPASEIRDPLPAGTAFRGAGPATCDGDPNITGTLGVDDVVRWSLPTLDPNDQVPVCLSLDVDEQFPGISVQNSAELVDPNEAVVASDQALTAVQEVTALSLSVNARPEPVEVGESLTYQIDLQNVAAFNVSGVTISDDISDDPNTGLDPPGCVSFDPNASLACGKSIGAPDPVLDPDGVLRWSVGSLSADEAVRVCFVLTIETCVGAQLRNEVQATDDRGEVATKVQRTRIRAPNSIRLRLFKDTPGQSKVKSGGDVRYRLRVQNLTDQAIANVTVRDDLGQAIPTGSLSFASALSSECGCSGPNGSAAAGVVTWSFASLPPGEQCVCLRATSAAGLRNSDVIENFAVATDPNGDSADASNTIRVFNRAFRVRILDDPDPVAVGSQITYTISIDNLGPQDPNDPLFQPLDGVIIKSRVPPGTTLVCLSGSTVNDCPAFGGGEFDDVALTRDPLRAEVRSRRVIWELTAPLVDSRSMKMIVTVDKRRRVVRGIARAREVTLRSKSKGRALTVVELE
ncbi:MAG: hypothetical protein ACE5FG_03545 [Myxococcota bacterium]